MQIRRRFSLSASRARLRQIKRLGYRASKMGDSCPRDGWHMTLKVWLEIVQQAAAGSGASLSAALTQAQVTVARRHARGQKFAEFGPRQHPLLHQHLDARRRRQVAKLVVRALRQDQMDFLQGISTGKASALTVVSSSCL